MRFATFSSGGRQLLHPESVRTDELTSHSPFTSIGKLSVTDEPYFDETFRYSTSLQRTLQGKLLLLDEIPFPMELLHSHYIHGYIGYLQSVIRQKDKYECQRCGNHEQRLFASFLCSRCDEQCTYCRKCIMMGRASECNPLVYWRGPDSIHYQIKNKALLKWNGELSPEQRVAAESVLQAVKEHRRQLIWAVCGSGKTEILFKGLEYACRNGMRVCIATPRVDVVLELEPRLRSVFPNVQIAALYGGSQRQGESQLVISTTHQLLRFRQAFDVMVIDEVDAFPYSFDPMLAFAVERAKKETAATILLTATPDDSLKQQAKVGELSTVKIPIRYHRHPLPVPRFEWTGNWEKHLTKKKLPKKVLNWCKERYDRKKPFLLFVPSVATAKTVKEILATYFPDVAFVFSEDPQRKEKVEQFREGKLSGLVTTTILERGVTIPKVEVAVLGSEHNIFTESALVQIAGRVGRSADYPTGDVCFFHFGMTKAMIAARRHILEMNEFAR